MKYKDRRTGDIYTVVYEHATFKAPNGDWVDAVVYRADATTYVRVKEDFHKKFEEVK